MWMPKVTVALALALAGAWIGGCDREISHREEVRVKEDGTVKRESETVRETPSGDIVKEEEKTIER